MHEYLTHLFQLARYDVFRLFWIFVIAWLVFNGLFAIVEKIVWGETFCHWGDFFLLSGLGLAFAWSANEMARRITVSVAGSHDETNGIAKRRFRKGGDPAGPSGPAPPGPL